MDALNDLLSQRAAQTVTEPPQPAITVTPASASSAPSDALDSLLAARASAPAESATPQINAAPQSVGGQLGHQLGLTARAGVTGVTALPTMIGDALNSGINVGIRGVNSVAGTHIPEFSSPSAALQKGMDAIGVAQPQNATERVVQDAASAMAGAGPTVAAGRVLAGAARPVVSAIGSGLAAQPGMQILGAAGAGTGAGAVREAGGGPLAQMAGALGGGFAGVAAGSAATTGVRAGINAAAKPFRPGITPQQAAQQATNGVNRVVSDMGPTATSAFGDSEVPNIQRQVATSLQQNPGADVAAAVRANDFRNLGIQPTLGQITRDPLQYAGEQNIRGVANVGDPLAARLNQQNTQLQNSLFSLGGQPLPDYQAGKMLQGALQKTDSQMGDAVRAAYQQARDSSGRHLDVPLQGLSQDYAQVLNDFGDKVPGGVRNNFESLGLQGGTQQKVFTMENAENLLKVINANTSNDPATNTALGMLRNSVKNAINSADDQGGVFATPRALAAQRFNEQDTVPALKAVIQDKVAPDDLINRYIINGKAEDVHALGRLISEGSPDVFNEMRNQLGAKLAQAGFGNSAAGDSAFSPARYSQALKQVGDAKLSAFYTPDEIAQLHTIGRVGSYMNSRPSASPVNSSNTAGALASLVGSGVSKLPYVGNLIENAQNKAFVSKALAAQLMNTARPAPVSPQASGLGAALFVDPLAVPTPQNNR